MKGIDKMAENTTKNRENLPDEPKEKLNFKGDVKVEKKTFGKKVVDFLFSDKIDSIGTWVAYTIVGPALKSLLYNSITGALQMTLWGGNNQQNITGSYIPGVGWQPQGGRRDPVNYNQPQNMGYAQPGPGIYQQPNNINGISFGNRDDAYVVLDRMNRDLARYGKVRVADYYLYCGVTGQESNWALQSTGWYNLMDAKPIMRTDGRWILQLPPVQNI